MAQRQQQQIPASIALKHPEHTSKHSSRGDGGGEWRDCLDRVWANAGA